MKTTKRHIINEQYSAVVEIDDTLVTISIEKPYKFLGIFNTTENVEMVSFELTFLEKEDGRPISNGLIQSYYTYYKYAPTFNLKLEIDKLYRSYIQSRSDSLKQAKQIDIILNQLD